MRIRLIVMAIEFVKKKKELFNVTLFFPSILCLFILIISEKLMNSLGVLWSGPFIHMEWDVYYVSMTWPG